MPSTFGRLVRLAWPLKGPISLAVLLGVLTVGSGVGLMATSAYLISAAALHPSVAALGVAIVGVRFFGIARGLFRYGERYLSHYVNFSLLARLRVWFYDAVEPLAPARLQAQRSGDLLARVVADINTLQDFYGRVLAPPLVALVMGGVLWVFLSGFDVAFAATLAVFYSLAGIALPLLTYLLSRRLGAELVATRAALHTELVDGIQGLADLVAFGQEARHAAQVAGLNRRLTRLQERQATVAGLQSALGSLLMNLALVGMLAVAVPRVRAGQLDGVYLAVLLLATLAGFEAVLPLPAAAQALGNSLAAARRLFALVDAAPAVRDPVAPAPVPAAYDLEVRGLSFGYPGAAAPALADLSFSLPAGGCLALVGASGAGKSTMANLLLRFWEYDTGEIVLGGRPLRDYAQADLHHWISVVDQSAHLFNTTIRQNLLLARPTATEAALIAAAEQAQLYSFIQSLPQGFDTPVGEGGLTLSGGERQRLAIARAFLKDAPILILDEPTAHLDALAEQAVLATLRTLIAGRTTILITHRLVGLDLAGEILVLHGGRAVERGPHHALLQQEGWYWQMWNLQHQMLAAGSVLE